MKTYPNRWKIQEAVTGRSSNAIRPLISQTEYDIILRVTNLIDEIKKQDETIS